MQLNRDFFDAKRANDEEAMDHYNDMIKEQKELCKEAKTLLDQAKAKFDEAKMDRIKHTENEYTKNRSSRKSQSKKKHRMMTEAEKESMTIMQDTNHDFTSNLSPETIHNIENEQATHDLTHDDDDDDDDCSQD